MIQYGAMAQMNTVKIANGNCGSAVCGGLRLCRVNNLHAPSLPKAAGLCKNDYALIAADQARKNTLNRNAAFGQYPRFINRIRRL